MEILFFASPDCMNCAISHNELKKSGLLLKHNFVYIDAMEDDTQDFCDEHDVDEIPHIKIYDDNNSLIFERCGLFLLEDVEEYLRN